MPFDFSVRSSGILFHPTSLPGKHGSGDLGPDAHRFPGILNKAGQSWWQMLPVSPPGKGPSFSPYDSASGFAGSPWLVSLEYLAREGLLTRDDITPVAGLSASKVNFPAVISYREDRLRRAFNAFTGKNGWNTDDYKEYCGNNSTWLEDFALFMALKKFYSGKPWTEWPEDLRTRKPELLLEARQRLANEIEYHRFVQFKFEQQWQTLLQEAHRRGIGLIGDIPIFVSSDSADVWSHQELFRLDKGGRPRRISGYPPDRFNSKGQVWGHPQYEWSAHKRTDFEWWVMRFGRLYDLFDALRIDHFLGFTRTWSIPFGPKDASSGKWVKSPGFKLFEAVERIHGKRPMISEDLGHMTSDDIKLRNRTGMLSMRIFQFGFGTEPDSTDHLPHNYSSHCAGYTGNHDNDTLKGWYQKLPPAQKRKVQIYTGGEDDSIHWDSIRTIQSSTANIVIFPLQDILGLGSGARMNIPGNRRGNWIWRSDTKIPHGLVNKLRQQTIMFERFSELIT